MYSSGYSKYSPGAKKIAQCRSKSKSCGYYMRIVFFFSSLIQSLIIVSLVLFLIYGKTQDSTTRFQDLEESHSRLSLENVALRQQRKNLTNLLNVTMTEKARNDWDLATLRHLANISLVHITEFDNRMRLCNVELYRCKSTSGPQTLTRFSDCNCGSMAEQLKVRLELVESNFTQITRRMREELDQITKERDTLNLEVIRLRRDKSTHEKEVDFFRHKCKDDFAQALSGVSSVSNAFLQKIDSLFPTHIAFQLTCPKQREHLEQIRTNCSSLSREVEDRFQRYLDNVGSQVSNIQSENSRLKAENWRLSEDYRWCSQNRTSLIQQHKQNLDKLQRTHDEHKEKLLVDKVRLNGDIEVLTNSVKYKTKVVEHLTEEIKKLNMSCMMTMYQGRSSLSGGSQSQLGLSNQPSWPAPGHSPGRGAGSSTGLLISKPASQGLSTSLLSSGTFSSLGPNRPESAGGLYPTQNKPALSGRGSLNTGLSAGLGLSSSGTDSNKPTSNVKSSSGYGSPSLSAGSTSKSGPSSSGTSWYGNSNTGQSKTGSGTGRGPSSGTGTFGAGRTNGHVSVAQHLRDLQRIINPAAPEEKQDLSRMLG